MARVIQLEQQVEEADLVVETRRSRIWQPEPGIRCVAQI